MPVPEGVISTSDVWKKEEELEELQEDEDDLPELP